ncbi:hypothetical protein KM043_007314 [Ampulex compressa]|nr:hypothetical protein KM043_007314 [Ampulex compressa]
MPRARPVCSRTMGRGPEMAGDSRGNRKEYDNETPPSAPRAVARPKGGRDSAKAASLPSRRKGAKGDDARGLAELCRTLFRGQCWPEERRRVVSARGEEPGPRTDGEGPAERCAVADAERERGKGSAMGGEFAAENWPNGFSECRDNLASPAAIID